MKGLTLLETIIASFILLCCFLVVVALFHSALRDTERSQSQELAVVIAERQLELMRAWSESPSPGLGLYNFDNLAIYDQQHVQASDYPEYSISTRVVAQTLYSTCSSTEKGIYSQSLALVPGVFAAPLVARQMTQTAKEVQVTVSWELGRQQLSLSSLFVQPTGSGFSPTQPIAVSLSAGTTPVSADGSITFTAVGYDATGNQIPDLFFHWDAISLTGAGTLSQARDGSTATLTNYIYTTAGAKTSSPGQLYLRATARYHGQVASGNSTVFVTQ